MSTLERDLLESMVRERDHELRSLKELNSKQEKIVLRLENETNEMLSKERQIKDEHKYEINELILKNKSMENELKSAMEKLPILSNSEKAKILKLNLDLGKSSNCSTTMDPLIKALRNNLTKSIRHICVLERQRTTMKSNSDLCLRSMKKEINDSREDRSKQEIKLLNEISKLDREKGMIEDDLRMKLLSQMDEMSKLHDEIEILREQQEFTPMRKGNVISPTSIISSIHDSFGKFDLVLDDDGERSVTEEEEEVRIKNVDRFDEGDKVRLMNQLRNVCREKECMENDLRHELRLQRETIRKLEEEKINQSSTIDALEKSVLGKENEIKEKCDSVQKKNEECVQNKINTIYTLEETIDELNKNISFLREELAAKPDPQIVKKLKQDYSNVV